MITLPLPLIFAVLILFLLLKSLRQAERIQVVHGLLAGCGLQAAMIALVHHYGVAALSPLVPVTGCALPPLAWLALRAALFERITLAQALPHALAPGFALFCALAAPTTLDIAVSGIFAGYGAAMLWALRPGSALPLARLDDGPWPKRIWRALAFALLLSALGDAVIAVAYITGNPGWHGLVISLVTSVSLVLIALLALAPEATGAREDTAADPPDAPGTPPETRAEDAALIARLEAVMRDERLFLDPDLTLARLARRLTVPAKALSAAINRDAGENVSRFVNGFRIRHACALLEEGMPVTEVVFAAGFNTKSNFNREFLRVTGQPPSAWRSGAEGQERDENPPNSP